MRIALIASRRLRHGPMSPLLRFARDFMPFLDKNNIVTTEGCYRAFLRAGLFWDHRSFFSVGSGYEGALVCIASGVVKGAEDEIDAVIYLIDPRDPSSNYPEANALKRECVVHEKPFLATSRSARLWALLSWQENAPTVLENYAIEVNDIPCEHICLPLNLQTIALIAHDKKKMEILKFVQDHFSFLLRFQRRVGTGTTGALLNGICPDLTRIPKDQQKELKSRCTILKRTIDAAKATGKLKAKNFVDPQESGPKGGDVQIAQMVLDNKCQTIIFFEDPSIPREHEQDIQLLERTGRARGKDVTCIHDSKTASDLAQKWAMLSGKYQPEPLLVATALERRFQVKAIVVEGEEDAWNRILEAASWYILAQIAALAADQKKLSNDVRVTVSWGIGLTELVQKLGQLRQRLEDRDKFEMDRREKQGLSSRLLALADNRYFRPGNVKVGPMQGIMAAADDAVEANAIARELAEFFNGKTIELALAALMADRPWRGVPEVILEHWERTDLLVTTCAPVIRKYSGHVPAPGFYDHFKQVEQMTCGDIGGIYLTREGTPYNPPGFRRIGMEKDQILSIKKRGGQTILIAGAQPEREEVTFAALQAGFISTLVTDLDFAQRLLRRAHPQGRQFLQNV